MADDGNDQSWIAELESALKEDGSVDIGKGDDDPFIPESLRPEIWKSCLVLAHRKPPYLDDIFDLPEQEIIREDCHNFVDSLGNAEEEKLSVISDVECLVSTYCRSTCQKYCKGNGWLDLLAPLLALGLTTEETYLLFEGLRSRYIPRSHSELSAVFRLLLLYHDPPLCSFLDTKKISPEAYTTSWTLFAGPCCLPVTTKIWDLYFQQADPFFLLFLGLVIIINAREQILTLKDSSRNAVCEALSSLPSDLQESDVEDLFSLAQEYASRTPGSFRQDLERVIFDDEEVPESAEKVKQALCLPVHVSELVENIHLPPALSEDSLRFFLVDCRPADQYNAGHMPTAFHLDPTLMLQGGGVYKMAVQGLLSAQRQALDAGSSAGGEHLCFIGCGALHEDQYTHMVVAGFLKDYRPYVSILSGGYHALHDNFGDNIDETLADHNRDFCRVCIDDAKRGSTTSGSSGSNTSPSKDIFGKIGAVVKSKSAEVKDKLLEYIVNPSGGNNPPERHVSPNDRRGKRYRGGATVFTIDDSPTVPDTHFGGDEEEDVSQFETVTLSDWKSRPDILATFDCTEIKINGRTYESELFVSESHVYVVRKGKRGKGELVVKKPLSAIARITCKKRSPEHITFKYWSSSLKGDSLVINDMDRFIIPRAKEATKLISGLIVELLKKENDASPSPEENP